MAPRTPGSPTLVLLPTDVERRRFLDLGGLEPGLALQALCGFGPVAAAARTAQLCASLRPRRVLLVGIAGAYDVERHPIGSALVFSRVAVDGVGVGEGRAFRGPPALGFPQWPGAEDARRPEPVHDELPLVVPACCEDAGLLLTTCAASAASDEARTRRERHPAAVAEDMEGFAVALACALHDVPVAVVRGISNQVGVRDPGEWRIPAALAAARRAATLVCEESAW